ncbi:TetR/AcrR family transcriptional regulator [Planosporangium sp. 12N6]|uniref:TetR/AcrR family transcriptional regulator n=1 Tax=Planosporangium spinosum TaxID=3402278 RepID=UPI003CE9024A
MARPRKISDERLLAAAGAVIARIGPRFTLADVAAEADVVAGTLVQRFGSKHGLLVALSRMTIEAVPGAVAVAADGTDDPVQVLRDGVVEWYAGLDDPAAAANNLAQLAVDFGDDELRDLLAQLYESVDVQVAALVRRAVRAGALSGAPPPDRAARILTALAEGSAIRWSVRPRGSLRDRVRADLDAVLNAWT